MKLLKDINETFKKAFSSMPENKFTEMGKKDGIRHIQVDINPNRLDTQNARLRLLIAAGTIPVTMFVASLFFKNKGSEQNKENIKNVSTKKDTLMIPNMYEIPGTRKELKTDAERDSALQKILKGAEKDSTFKIER